MRTDNTILNDKHFQGRINSYQGTCQMLLLAVLIHTLGCVCNPKELQHFLIYLRHVPAELEELPSFVVVSCCMPACIAGLKCACKQA